LTSLPDATHTGDRHRGPLSELLKVQGRLALREPYWLLGIGLPFGLLLVFWYIGVLNPGAVASTGLTILELWTPTILVISYIAIGMIGLPATFARDREIGWLRRISTTPVGPSRLLAVQLLLNFIIASVATGIMIAAAAALFGAPLTIGIEFVGVAILAIAELFSLGLVVAAIAPSQQAATYIAGGLFFPLMFFAGLWVQPAQVGGPLATIMYYSPAGAAVRALLYSVFNATPPYTTIVTMVGYTVVFVFVAVRYFRWE
jgi:ABC-2 type transport system permease protein